MDNRITADLDTLFEQSKGTAKDYLSKASYILDECVDYHNTFENAIRLAELMAKDFNTALIALNIQRLADSISEFSEHLDGININIHSD